MRIVIFGSTGMVGQGALREALRDTRVTDIVAVVRTPSKISNPKLTEIVLPDMAYIAEIADRLGNFDACFFCLGVSSLGMSEAEYTRITFGLTMTIANLLLLRSPAMTFIYVSGMGTDRESRQMWPRVKARTEDALAAINFEGVFSFRPGFIQPLHGITSKTSWYAVIYALTRPVSPLLLRLFPRFVTTTERFGRAMIEVAANGWPRGTLENDDINAAGLAEPNERIPAVS